MDDLISRSKVIDVLKETGIIVDNDLGHLVVEEIERIPTAYDVEKVMEQLEDASVYDDVDDVFVIREYKAIEIVRKGGVE